MDIYKISKHTDLQILNHPHQIVLINIVANAQTYSCPNCSLIISWQSGAWRIVNYDDRHLYWFWIEWDPEGLDRQYWHHPFKPKSKPSGKSKK